MKNLFASPKALWSGLIVLMLLLTACGAPAEAPAAEALAEAVAAEEGSTGGESGAAPAGGDGATSGGDLCANDYMPIVEGASWAYSGTSFEGPYSWVQSVSGVSGGGFTITNTFDGGDTAVVVHQWSCTPEGLAALDYGSGPEGSVGTSGIQADFETVAYSGISLPRDVNVGDSWTQTYTLAGDMAMGDGLSAQSSGTATYNYSAVGIETVSVPAGTFEALKVAISTHLDIQISMGAEAGPPFSISIQSQTWFVEGVGWVQTESTYDFEGFVFSDLIQLQSYNIP